MANTKERILMAALELFAEEGYDAVGVDQIAEKVGIKGPSLYKHFKGKQHLFDSLVEEVTRQYEEHSIFSNMDWESYPLEKIPSTPEELMELIGPQVVFVTESPVIRLVRRLLVIEQFRNERIRGMEEKRSFQDIYDFLRGLLGKLVEKGILMDEDLEAMTLIFMAPISMEIYRVDRYPEKKDEAMAMIERHIEQFFRVYGRHVEVEGGKENEGF
ncbi:MAG: TetR/AcrR family transcriptional regulator [Spirochaetales bacterium]|nr:TetR/AcrR family transcriptional regulator [Candidatus Physcosoma equi]